MLKCSWLGSRIFTGAARKLGFEPSRFWEEGVASLKDPELINAQPGGRWSALHQAAFQGRFNQCVDLLELGADGQSLTGARETPFDVVSKNHLHYKTYRLMELTGPHALTLDRALDVIHAEEAYSGSDSEAGRDK